MVNENFPALSELLVEWVYDHADSQSIGDVSIHEFCVEHGLDSEGSWSFLRYSKGKGLVEDRHSTFGDPRANLTPAGTRWVESRRERRANPLLRARAAREALLKWLWACNNENIHMPSMKDFEASGEANFEGDPFSESEIDRASEYLYKNDLITGVMVDQCRGPVRAQITTQGEYCVEHHGGNVSDYEQQKKQGGGTVFNIQNNTGNIAANSRDFTMNATTNNGIQVSEIVMLARALRQAAPILELPEDDAEELVATADRIENEAGRDNPDASRLQRWGSTVIGILNSPVVSGALGPVLAAYTQGVIPGLPPVP